MGSRAAYWSRAPAASPASPVQRARFVAGGQGVGVLGAQDPLADGQQGGELVAGPGRIPRLPGPVGEVVAGGQGVGVLGAVGITVRVRVGDQPEQVPGCRCNCRYRPRDCAIRHRPPLVRSRTARACGSSTADTGHAAGKFRVGGDRRFDQGGGGLFPLGRLHPRLAGRG